MAANEKAEAVLIVIKRIMKWVAIAIAALIAIGLLIWGIAVFTDWYTVDRHKAKVKVVAFFDDKNCPSSYPLFIGVVNNSSKTIESLYAYVKVTKKGYSKQLNYDRSFDYDKIIPPNDSWGSCWIVLDDNYDWAKRKPLDGKDMDAAVTLFHPTFAK